MSSHYLERCSCGTVIAQCRCPGLKTETVVPRGCAVCRSIPVRPVNQPVPRMPRHPNYSPPANTRQLPRTGIPFPVCDICKRQVRTLRHYEDKKTGEWVLVAICHGDTDTIRLTRLPTGEGDELEPGRAFVRRRIAETPVPLPEPVHPLMMETML